MPLVKQWKKKPACGRCSARNSQWGNFSMSPQSFLLGHKVPNAMMLSVCSLLSVLSLGALPKGVLCSTQDSWSSWLTHWGPSGAFPVNFSWMFINSQVNNVTFYLVSLLATTVISLYAVYSMEDVLPAASSFSLWHFIYSFDFAHAKWKACLLEASPDCTDTELNDAHL